MKQSITNFLEFNGKNLLFLSKDGEYFIALKPICEALNVDYIRQHKNTNDDPILGPVLSKQTMQIPDDQARNMVCLPEKYIYGWIFSIKSKSEELIKYKKICYEILFLHFHGTITSRKKLLQRKTDVSSELHQLTIDLKENEKYQRIEFLKAEQMRIGKELIENDNKTIIEQTKLFNFL